MNFDSSFYVLSDFRRNKNESGVRMNTMIKSFIKPIPGMNLPVEVR